MTTSRSPLLLFRALWKRRRLSKYCYISILWLSRPQAIVAFSTHSLSTTTPATTTPQTTATRGQHRRSGKNLASVRNDIDRLVLERTRARWEGDYQQADMLLNEIQSHDAIPPGYEISLTDVPRTEGGGSSWELQPIAEYHHQRLLGSSGGPSILQLAHAALGLAVHSASVRHLNKASDIDNNHYQRQVQLRSLVEQAHDRLDTIYALKDNENDDGYLAEWNLTLNPTNGSTANEPSLLTAKLLQYELGGRMSADAAFWFALAGIQEDVHNQDNDPSRPPLLDRLASVAAVELERYGFRQKRREKDILEIVDRFAAAGVRDHAALETVVQACLEQKQNDGVKQEGAEKDKNTIHNKTSLLQLHSDRSLFRLWKFSTRQKKQWAFLNSARKHWESQHLAEMERIDKDLPTATTTTIITASDRSAYYDWDTAFEDTSRPLVVDIGCGMGVSLLGLASCDDSSGMGDASVSSKILLQGASGNHESDPLTWSE